MDQDRTVKLYFSLTFLVHTEPKFEYKNIIYKLKRYNSKKCIKIIKLEREKSLHFRINLQNSQ